MKRCLFSTVWAAVLALLLPSAAAQSSSARCGIEAAALNCPHELQNDNHYSSVVRVPSIPLMVRS